MNIERDKLDLTALMMSSSVSLYISSMGVSILGIPNSLKGKCQDHRDCFGITKSEDPGNSVLIAIILNLHMKENRNARSGISHETLLV